jgi:hypothetical protein
MKTSLTTDNTSVQFTADQTTTSTFGHPKKDAVVESSTKSRNKARPDKEGDRDDIVTIAEARVRMGPDAPSRDAFHKALKRGKLNKQPQQEGDKDFRFLWGDLIDYFSQGGIQKGGTSKKPTLDKTSPGGEADPLAMVIPVAESDPSLSPSAMPETITASGESAPSEPLGTLDEEDIHYLEVREEIVSNAVKSSITAAKALYDIKTYRNGALWKKDFRSFEHYLLAKWGYQKSHGYRLAEIGGFVAELVCSNSPNGENLPKNEGQLRALFAEVPKEHRVECWTEITAQKDPAELTGSIVAEEVKKFVRDKGLATKPPKSAKTSDHTRAMHEIAKLRSILAKLPNPGRFDEHLLTITTLIGLESDDGVIEVTAMEVNHATSPEPAADTPPSK